MPSKLTSALAQIRGVLLQRRTRRERCLSGCTPVCTQVTIVKVCYLMSWFHAVLDLTFVFNQCVYVGATCRSDETGMRR